MRRQDAIPVDMPRLPELLDAMLIATFGRSRHRVLAGVRARAHGEPAIMHAETVQYNQSLAGSDAEICSLLAKEIDRGLPEAENKIWHAHPVWFLDGNPVVGYSKLKGCVRLLFWSGQSFQESGLQKEGGFQAAEARYTSPAEVNLDDLRRWLGKARDIQWDYKNIVRRKGRLERLK